LAYTTPFRKKTSFRTKARLVAVGAVLGLVGGGYLGHRVYNPEVSKAKAQVLAQVRTAVAPHYPAIAKVQDHEVITSVAKIVESGKLNADAASNLARSLEAQKTRMLEKMFGSPEARRLVHLKYERGDYVLHGDTVDRAYALQEILNSAKKAGVRAALDEYSGEAKELSNPGSAGDALYVFYMAAQGKRDMARHLLESPQLMKLFGLKK